MSRLYYIDPNTSNEVEITSNPFTVTVPDVTTTLGIGISSNQNGACIQENVIGLDLAPTIRWAGDLSANGIPGTGNGAADAGNAAGTNSSTFSIKDSYGNNQGPEPGQTITISFYSEDDQIMASATYDYSSIIDLEADVPLSSSGATYIPPAKYNDASTTPILFAYNDFKNHFVNASCNIDANGFGVFSFNKNNFATAKGLTNANAIAIRVQLTIAAPLGTSAPSSMDMCININDGFVNNPYVITPVTEGRSIVFGNSSVIQGIGDVDTGDCGTLPTIRSIGSTANTRYGAACQTFRVNGEAPWVVGSGSIESNFSYWHRNTTADSYSWSLLYNEDNIATDLYVSGLTIDDQNLENGKPVIYLSLTSSGGSFITSSTSNMIHIIYWDGTAWDYSTLNLNASTKELSWVDPRTGDLYYEAQNDFRVVSYSGPNFSISERANPANYSTVTKIMDLGTTTITDGVTDVGIAPFSIYYNYAGDYNGKPSFYSGFSNTGAWAWIFWNGSSWEVKILFDGPGTTLPSSLPSQNITESNLYGFNVQYLGSISQQQFPENTDATLVKTVYFFDYINDIIYRGDFVSGNVSTPTWEMSITEYVPQLTGLTTTTLY